MPQGLNSETWVLFATDYGSITLELSSLARPIALCAICIVEGPAICFAVPPKDSHPVRCLILACGNTLRSDDGVGPWLAAWAEERFAAEPAVRVISRQQWTPDLTTEVARTESVLFIDCSLDAAPGAIRIHRTQPARAPAGLAAHHMDAAELLAMSEELYAVAPSDALLLTIGAGCTEMGESFSPSLTAALPEACRLLESSVLRMLAFESH